MNIIGRFVFQGQVWPFMVINCHGLFYFDRGYSVSSVATRLDITTHSLYAWIKKYGPDSSTNKEQSDAQAEILRLQKELKRVTDERDMTSPDIG